MSCQLGYQQVTIKGDNESTMKSLKKSFQQLRGTLGLRTLMEDSIPHDHASNGLVERATQTVRRQGNALLEDLRKRTKLALRHNHPVFGWAMRQITPYLSQANE